MPESNIGGPEPPKSNFTQIYEDMGYTVQGAVDLLQDTCSLVGEGVRKAVGGIYHEIEGSLLGDFASCLGVEYYLGRPEVTGKSSAEASLPVVEITDQSKTASSTEGNKPAEPSKTESKTELKAEWTVPDIAETPSERSLPGGSKSGNGFFLTPEQKYRAAAGGAFETEPAGGFALVADPKFEAARAEFDRALPERNFAEARNHIGEKAINRSLSEAKFHEMHRTRIVSESGISAESFATGLAIGIPIGWAASSYFSSKERHSIKTGASKKSIDIGGAEK